MNRSSNTFGGHDALDHARTSPPHLPPDPPPCPPGEHPKAVARLDARLRVLAANDRFFRYLSRAPQDTCGRSFYDFVPLSVHPKLRQQFSRLLSARQAEFTDRVPLVRPAGADAVVDVVGIAVYSDTGRVDAVLLALTPGPATTGRPPVPGERDLLTEMDSRVLEGVAAGVSTGKLAPALNLSRGGVEYHVSRLLRKLEANNRTSLVSRAYATGILVTGAWPPRVAPQFVK